MSIHTPVWQLSAVDLHAAYKAGQLSPVDVTAALLERIAAINSQLNAFVYVDTDGAMQAAEASAARYRDGEPLSALDGVPASVKDSLLVGGMPATWGSRLLENNIPAEDELPVARLRAAGAVLLGKTNLPEFTVQGYTDNLLFGPAGNPWNPDLTPGGSSGGAVSAVAAGLGPIALGTDGGGSTRRPAGHTGLVGFKPGTGRIPRNGGFPESYYDMEVVGLFGRTVSDVAVTLSLLSEPDPRDRHSLPYAGMAPQTAPDHPRILYIPRFGSHPVEPAILRSIDQVSDRLREIGCQISVGTLPFDIDAVTATMATLMPAGLAMAVDRMGGPERITPTLLPMYETGKGITGSAYLAALNAGTELRRQMAGFFQNYDAILTPAAAAQPWPKATVYPDRIAGLEAGPRGHAIYTGWVNLAGLPGIGLPGQPDAAGLPIGFQLIGGFGSDAMLLEIGLRYEAAAPETRRWPPLFP